MPPIEVGPTRPVGAIETRTPRTAGEATARAMKSDEKSPAAAVVRSDVLDPGQSAPVDTDRVSQIRRAIETGTYPVLPFKVADAMIAAGLLLRTKS